MPKNKQIPLDLMPELTLGYENQNFIQRLKFFKYQCLSSWTMIIDTFPLVGVPPRADALKLVRPRRSHVGRILKPPIPFPTSETHKQAL